MVNTSRTHPLLHHYLSEPPHSPWLIHYYIITCQSLHTHHDSSIITSLPVRASTLTMTHPLLHHYLSEPPHSLWLIHYYIITCQSLHTHYDSSIITSLPVRASTLTMTHPLLDHYLSEPPHTWVGQLIHYYIITCQSLHTHYDSSIITSLPVRASTLMSRMTHPLLDHYLSEPPHLWNIYIKFILILGTKVIGSILRSS